MKDLIEALLTLDILIALVYGCYWLAKNISYSVFYEEMVIDSIKEVVKRERVE